MVDFHGRPASASAALAYIDALAPGRPMFVEEVLPPGDTAGLAPSPPRPMCRSPLANGWSTGSNSTSCSAARAVDIVQPDICHCGGLLEAKKIAAMAEAVSIGVAPHNPLGPIAGVAALHFAVSTPNHVIQEEMVGAVPWYFDVVQGPIRMVEGCWQVPDAPGLGIEVDEAVCARASVRARDHPHDQCRPRRRHDRRLVVRRWLDRLKGQDRNRHRRRPGHRRGHRRAFAAEGAIVVIAEKNPSTGTGARQRRQPSAARSPFVETDVAEPAAVARMADCGLARFGRIDILVNNAGDQRLP